tara:strand:+ start:17 stop:1075 length:1059 start_codon:yes stop_codon:yes gene_type:complete
MSKKPFGWIYKISHKDMPNQCYIGSTKVTIKKRFQGHIRDANKANKAGDSDAKLHTIMWAHQPKTFKVEEIDTAENLAELVDKELHYQDKFDSIRNGWNKNKAANITRVRGKPIKVKIDGAIYEASSKAGLCRELGISNSTVNHWQKKGKTLDFSVKKALSAKKLTHEKELIIVFRKEFKDVNKLAKSKFNKHKLHPSTIRQRVRKGMTYEEALLEKSNKPKEIEIKFKNKILKFKNITEAYKVLSREIKDIHAYSSVISSISKGATLEEAFGIDKPKWLKKFSNIEDLFKKGYKLTGELDAQSNPVVVKKNKEVFSSVKIFSRTYGFDYTTIAAEIKSGLSPEEIISKRDD